jgi:hypothetical protein
LIREKAEGGEERKVVLFLLENGGFLPKAAT